MMDDHSTGRELELAPPEGVRAGDYHLIEEAVMETARGRWFLREYARRIRAAETSQLLAALERIEKSVAHSKSIQAFEAGKEAAAAEEIQAVPADPATHPDGRELQEIQEKLLDIVWYMRERGFDARLCSAIRLEAGKLERIASHSQEPPAECAPVPATAPAAAAPAEAVCTASVETALPSGEEKAAPVSVTAFPAYNLRVAGKSSDSLPVQAGGPAQMEKEPASAVFSKVDTLDTRDKLAMFA